MFSYLHYENIKPALLPHYLSHQNFLKGTMLEIITFSTTLRANNLQMGEKFKPSIEELMNLNMQNATLNVMDENEKIPRRCK